MWQGVKGVFGSSDDKAGKEETMKSKDCEKEEAVESKDRVKKEEVEAAKGEDISGIVRTELDVQKIVLQRIVRTEVDVPINRSIASGASKVYKKLAFILDNVCSPYSNYHISHVLSFVHNLS